MDALRRLLGRTLSPELVGEPVDRDGPAPVEEEDREQRALLRRP
jgi:hypothetical protein